MRKIFPIILVLSISQNLYSQSSNLTICYSIVDSISNTILMELDERDSCFVETKWIEGSDILKNRFLLNIKEKVRVDFANKNLNTKLILFIDSVGVAYPRIWRNGLFGSYFVERKITLKGNYRLAINRKNILKEILYIKSDTVEVEKIGQLENSQFAFTQSEIPTEPFVESLVEPVIAIGTAILSVVLFFFVRTQ